MSTEKENSTRFKEIIQAFKDNLPQNSPVSDILQYFLSVGEENVKGKTLRDFPKDIQEAIDSLEVEQRINMIIFINMLQQENYVLINYCPFKFD